MKKILVSKLLVIGLAVLFLGASATMAIAKDSQKLHTMERTWSDDFEAYTVGQMLDGTPDDGGWKGWGNLPSAGAPVVDTYAHGGTKSVQIDLGADLVHEYTGYSSGEWVYTAWQYIPNDFVGMSYFIMLSAYDDAGATNVWTVQISFDSELDLVTTEFNGFTLPLTYGQWVEIRCEIDLTTDWLKMYYNGMLLDEHAWTDTVQGGGGGTLNIAAVDLFANGASPVYYDDISLLPAGAGLICSAGGPYFGEVGDLIQFTGFATGGTEPYTYAWTFGDGETSAEQNPTHAYDTAGEYNVSLTVTDSAKDTVVDYTTATITEPAPEIVIESIAGGLGVSAVLKNTGTVDATAVPWEIALEGGLIIIGKSKSGTVDIPAG
ncbi:MAG: PKD domain-containing protein, partial [Candidatus Thermoplasmatota archaeon]|nr:PKD domain-containing protein [Candidatus Thermoplasmatota archaeon]